MRARATRGRGRCSHPVRAFVNSRGPALQRTAYLLTGDRARGGPAPDGWPSLPGLEPHPARRPEGYVRKGPREHARTWWRRNWRGYPPTASSEAAHADHGTEDRLAGRRRARPAATPATSRDRPAVPPGPHRGCRAHALGISVGTVKARRPRRSPSSATTPRRRPENGSSTWTPSTTSARSSGPHQRPAGPARRPGPGVTRRARRSAVPVLRSPWPPPSRCSRSSRPPADRLAAPRGHELRAHRPAVLAGPLAGLRQGLRRGSGQRAEGQ